MEYHHEVLEGIIDQTRTYKAQALLSRGTFDLAQGNPERALYFYTEGLKASPSISEYIGLTRAIAVLKAQEGFHRLALREMEKLAPIIRHAEPRLYYDFLNSYAVELVEGGRVYEAENVSAIAVSSPFGPYYPEWQETLSDVRSKRRQRSAIAFSRAIIEREYEAELETSDNSIYGARVQAAIDFMNANLHRHIALTELASLVNLSHTYFSHLFKTEMGIAPGQYLTGLKMEKAAQLLATTFLNVKEVMAKVGYNSKGNFGRTFSRYYDVTPSEYRKRFFPRY